MGIEATTRRIDNSCKISLPKDMLKELKIKSGDAVEIKVEGNNLVICKPNANSDWTKIGDLLLTVDPEIVAIVSDDSVVWLAEGIEDVTAEDVKGHEFSGGAFTFEVDGIFVATNNTDALLKAKSKELLAKLLELGITAGEVTE